MLGTCEGVGLRRVVQGAAEEVGGDSLGIAADTPVEMFEGGVDLPADLISVVVAEVSGCTPHEIAITGRRIPVQVAFRDHKAEADERGQESSHSIDGYVWCRQQAA